MPDSRTRPETSAHEAESLDNLAACASQVDAIFADCAKAHPDFGLSPDDFREAMGRAVRKYLMAQPPAPSTEDIGRFIGELQDRDLYLALACATGNEPAWWEFDRQYRSFIERWARHLVRSGSDADEIIDFVYVELLGTKVVAGVRQSKFRTYTGRGTLRGWLRTVMLHAVVDLYRGRKDEISLEEWSGSAEETRERQTTHATARGTEELMLVNVVRERYRTATMTALDQSLAALDDHETLLLLYYHVEGLKLREIARIVEQPRSPIRRWFQRQSKMRAGQSPGRVHESTVMRWLEKVYKKVSDHFHAELANKHGLNPAEIEICKAIASEDPAQGVRLDARVTDSEGFNAEEPEGRRVEGAS
ncbi:MAG: polymerase sigma-70 factor, subfamily [Blastocatellia bacterium]|nr:polymerase sigma-70 factor, subfamily [Blastocatellia bacterium]